MIRSGTTFVYFYHKCRALNLYEITIYTNGILILIIQHTVSHVYIIMRAWY